MKILEDIAVALLTVVFDSYDEALIAHEMLLEISTNMAIKTSAIGELKNESQFDKFQIVINIPIGDYHIMLPILRGMLIERLERVM
ncbi:MAG: hypothetical protein O210_OD1C00001G0324 [Parcubacteria bacterium RAAC4_OD1_1]|nr:MAG: hypothetical protein O210_OD1C00001G0324 [Parcubacteria bacterium RAAC4_OD1_1]